MKENQWINVKDQLPKFEIEVLICEDNNQFHLGQLFYFYERFLLIF